MIIAIVARGGEGAHYLDEGITTNAWPELCPRVSLQARRHVRGLGYKAVGSES